MQTVAVVGAGTMGNGIAHVFAMSGFQVNLISRSEESLNKALLKISKNLDRQISKELISEQDKAKTLGNIHKFINLQDGVQFADLIVEAIYENKDDKLRLFEQLNLFCKPEAILASNTSSISIATLAGKISLPNRVIGMHFMNPVPVMKLVEIINGKDGSKAVCETVVELCKKLDKIPVVVNDSPGFIANRILMPMINEAILSLQEGVAGVAEIDTIMKLGMAHPMGPLQLADLIGLDVCFSILTVMAEGLGPKYAPAALLKEMIDSNRLGLKTGVGFYEYEAGSKDLKVASNLSSGQETFPVQKKNPDY